MARRRCIAPQPVIGLVNKISTVSGVFSRGMSQPSPASFLRDPITVPRKELIEHYRALAARYQQLAERQQRSSIHQGLVGLARQCAAMADALTAPTVDQSKPELSESEILLLLNRVVAEEKPVSPAPAPGHPVPRDLSLDEILQKVQQDIAEGRPRPAAA